MRSLLVLADDSQEASHLTKKLDHIVKLRYSECTLVGTKQNNVRNDDYK